MLTKQQQINLIKLCIEYYDDNIEISELGDKILEIFNEDNED